MNFVILSAVLLMCCLQNGESYKNITDLDIGPVFTFKDIEAWKAPEDVKRKYPLYISGVDKESRPVFVVEGGRWDFRAAVEANGTDYEQMRRQISKGVFFLVQMLTGNVKKVASSLKIPDGEEVFDEVGLIVDMEGFEYIQSTSPRTMLFFFEIARALSKLTDYVAYAHLINTNFVVETVLNTVRPVLGSFADKLEVSGTNKGRWIPQLLKRISRDQLPPWYGGSKGYKPALVFGR